MKLTREQQEILDGKQGEIMQRVISCLYRYGNAIDATELIPVTSVHTVISSMEWVAMVLSPPGTEINEKRIADIKRLLAPLRVRAKTTTQSPPAPNKVPPTKGSYPVFYELDDTVEIIRGLGLQATLTCTPYLAGNMPIRGETCSWMESSAIAWANSILGARTNRDGLESTFFSSLLGLTPKYGLHLDENRKGTHLIRIEDQPQSLSDWGALGYFAGKVAGIGVPVFTNLRRPSVDEAKQLCSAVATSGGVALFHIAGVTPEAPTEEIAFSGNKPVESVVYNKATREEIYHGLNSKTGGYVGAVCIGCPHASLAEIEEVARLIEGRHVAENTSLWIGADFHTRALAERQGSAQIIESAGGQFIGKCIITTNTDMAPVNIMATNAVKLAHYAANYLQSKVFFGDVKQCLDIAVKGGV
jgi:predicted aconitase